MTSILDAENCWDIVNGDEGELALVELRTVERVVVNQEAVTESRSHSIQESARTRELTGGWQLLHVLVAHR